MLSTPPPALGATKCITGAGSGTFGVLRRALGTGARSSAVGSSAASASLAGASLAGASLAGASLAGASMSKTSAEVIPSRSSTSCRPSTDAA
ncbi:pentapeptide repeat-containing protein [Frankia sp. Cas4]|uniref:pentapeptide repeat-containing protein n=1 Tax=Frankia sp. Cas4 TaxID=3073927 RepID=UPI003A0FE21C